MRLYIPNGNVEVGLFPNTDGYGNVVTKPMVIINYDDEWLALDDVQTRRVFFISVHDTGYSFSPDRRCWFERSNDPLIGAFKMFIKNDNFVSIDFTEPEGEKQFIQQFWISDLSELLKLEPIICGRIEAVKIQSREFVETARHCLENGSEIMLLAANWRCSDIIVDVAVNHS